MNIHKIFLTYINNVNIIGMMPIIIKVNTIALKALIVFPLPSSEIIQLFSLLAYVLLKFLFWNIFLFNQSTTQTKI